MDAAQAHLVAVAVEERIKELRYAVRFYDDRGWDDLAAEYRVRLDEIERLVPDDHRNHSWLVTPTDCAECNEEMTTIEQVAWAQ